MRTNCWNEIMELNIFDQILNNDFSRIYSPFQFAPLEDKIAQYYYTSLGIKFGNCLEKLVKEVIIENGGEYVERRIGDYDCDQLFIYDGTIYLIEQKVRDDHDSSKKRGQVDNYLNKIEVIKEKYPEYELKSCCWFIDPMFHKNKNYYLKELSEDEVLYGKDIDKFLPFEIYDEVQGEVVELRETITTASFLDNKVDYHDYTAAKILPLFRAGDTDKIVNMFFKDFSYKGLLEYCENSRKTVANKELIEVLKTLC